MQSFDQIWVSAKEAASPRPIYVVAGEFVGLPEREKRWLEASGASPAKPSVVMVPDDNGAVASACLVLGADKDPFSAGLLSGALAAGDWAFAGEPEAIDMLTTGYLLGAYKYARYKADGRKAVRLVIDERVDWKRVRARASAVWLTRDLVNTPANDMGPDDIEAAARQMAKSHKAQIKVITGDDLLAKNFPLIHAVGRAASQAPRLIDMRWGKKSAPKLTLVGKGVAYDTGGLDIKPPSSMRNMKKDMGGAANVLGLASMIMDAGLNVHLRVLIPAVENSISANAFRPGDVYPSRKGITVEIGNTDAEGRLVLADALTLADEDKPDMLIDMATLTGAARVALGPEVVPFYSTDDALCDALNAASVAERDPLWRMPLWQPYAKGLSSTVADCCNITGDGMAGSVTAALFLQKFVTQTASWSHFDIFAWVPSAKPHAPVGGEAQAIRALMNAICERFA